MVIRRKSGWFKSDASSHEISVVIWNNCSNIGRTPPTIVAVTIPLPMAKELCDPIIGHSFAVGGKRLIGPMKQQLIDKLQIPTQTPSQPRTSLQARRAGSVRYTAVNPAVL